MLDAGPCLAAQHGVHALTFIVTDDYGHWGSTDMQHRVVYLPPNIPPSKQRDVLLHEIAHVRLHDALGLSVTGGRRSLNALFGGTGWHGAELAADCLARRWGAAWTHYTSCQDAGQRERLTQTRGS